MGDSFGPGHVTVRRAAFAALLALAVLVQCVFTVRLIAGAVYASRGDAALAERDFAAADIAYARAVELVPYRGDWVYSRAGVLRNESGHEAALLLYDEALRLAPFAEPTMVAMAESLMETGRPDDAEAMLERARKVTPYDWRVHHLAGVLAMKDGRAEDAVTSLRQAQELAPTLDPLVQTPLAAALFAAGSYSEAEREASRAIRLQPLAPEHRLIRGKAQLAMGHAEDARKDLAWAARAYRAQLGRGQNVAEPLAEAEERLASAFIAEGRPLSALEPLDRLAGDSPDAAAEATGRLLLWLQRMGARAPAELWAFAIDALIEVGRFEDVDRSMSRVDEIFPDDAGGVFVSTRARLLLSEGRAAEAIAMLADAPETAKSRPEFRIVQAQAMAMAGNSATAALEFRALIDSAQSSPRVRRQAAEGLAALPDQ